MKVGSKKRLNPLESCTVEKSDYDKCFKEWYRTKFLKVCIQSLHVFFLLIRMLTVGFLK